MLESLVKFAPKQYVISPTAPKICCRITSKNCGIRITSLQTL